MSRLLEHCLPCVFDLCLFFPAYRKDNRSRYFAHIDFGSKDVTQAIIDEHKRTPLTLNNGRQIIVDFAPPAIIEDTSPYYTLYMAAFRGDEARLREYFGLHSPFIRRIAFRMSLLFLTPYALLMITCACCIFQCHRTSHWLSRNPDLSSSNSTPSSAQLPQ